MFDEFVGGGRDLDFVGYTVGLHSTGGIHSISPNIVGEFSNAQNPGNH